MFIILTKKVSTYILGCNVETQIEDTLVLTINLNEPHQVIPVATQFLVSYVI